MILHDSDGRPKFAVDVRFLIITLILGFILLLIILFRPQTTPVGSCAEMNLKGYTSVTPKNKYFNTALDRDNDGIEC